MLPEPVASMVAFALLMLAMQPTDPPADGTCYVMALDRPCMVMPTPMAEQAHDVVWCESKYDPTRVGALGEIGPFQLHPVHRERAERMGYAWAEVADPMVNTEVAISIYQEQGFGPWTCYAR